MLRCNVGETKGLLTKSNPKMSETRIEGSMLSKRGVLLRFKLFAVSGWTIEMTSIKISLTRTKNEKTKE